MIKSNFIAYIKTTQYIAHITHYNKQLFDKLIIVRSKWVGPQVFPTLIKFKIVPVKV